MNHQHDEIDIDLPASEAPAGPFQTLANAQAAIGTVWIFFLMFLIVADVLGRNFLDKPITGVAEFAGRSIVAIVFLQLAAAIGSGRMTRSDFLIQIVHRRLPCVGRILEVLYALIGATLFAVLAYSAWPEFQSAWTSNEFFGIRGVYTIPTWPFRGLIVLGSVMTVVAYLLAVPGLLQARVSNIQIAPSPLSAGH